MATDASGALWREQVRARADYLSESAKEAVLDRELSFDANGHAVADDTPEQQQLVATYDSLIDVVTVAKTHADHSANPWSWLRGSLVEAAWGRIHDGEILLIKLQSPEQLLGRMPEIQDLVKAYLPADNSSRAALDKWWGSTNVVSMPPGGGSGGGSGGPPNSVDPRDLMVGAVIAAYESADAERTRVRTFRNVLLGTSLAIAILLLGLGLVGLAWPNAMSLCARPASTPTMLICPTGERQSANGPSGGDVFLVELVGLVGAALAGVRAVSASQKVAGPYSLAVAQALLKAAAGSTTAVVGVVLLGAGIVPSVGQLPSQAAILAYAIVFGYAQQLVTGIVDKRADAVLQAASPATPAQAT